MVWGPVEYDVARPAEFVPSVEMESLADKEECLLPVEKRLSSARDILVRGIPERRSSMAMAKNGGTELTQRGP